MATDKKRIQIYIDQETISKFRVISALKGYKSMSEYAGKLVEQNIQTYESEHGEIHIEDQGGKME